MNYYNEIKNKLIDDEIYSKVKDYSKERHTLLTHYEVGKLLLEAGGKYILPEDNKTIFSSEFILTIPSEKEFLDVIENEKKNMELL